MDDQSLLEQGVQVYVFPGVFGFVWPAEVEFVVGHAGKDFPFADPFRVFGFCDLDDPAVAEDLDRFPFVFLDEFLDLS